MSALGRPFEQESTKSPSKPIDWGEGTHSRQRYSCQEEPAHSHTDTVDGSPLAISIMKQGQCHFLLSITFSRISRNWCGRPLFMHRATQVFRRGGSPLIEPGGDQKYHSLGSRSTSRTRPAYAAQAPRRKEAPQQFRLAAARSGERLLSTLVRRDVSWSMSIMTATVSSCWRETTTFPPQVSRTICVCGQQRPLPLCGQRTLFFFPGAVAMRILRLSESGTE